MKSLGDELPFRFQRNFFSLSIVANRVTRPNINIDVAAVMEPPVVEYQ